MKGKVIKAGKLGENRGVKEGKMGIDGGKGENLGLTTPGGLPMLWMII